MNNKGTHSYRTDSRNKNIQIYINGKLYSRKQANISVFDSGFLLGDGVWEGIRLINGQMVFIDEHLDRLYQGAEKLTIDIGKNRDELLGLIWKTLNANGMENGVHIRLIVSRGLKKTPYQHPSANMGDSSIVIIPEYKEVDEKINKHGIHLVTVNTRRGTSNSQDPRINSLSKQNCITACIEADRAGADEGIMLDLHGNVSTCNSTNFFIVKKSEVWTSTGEFCLPGVTRKAVIDLCSENEIPVFQKDFRIMDVHSSDEAFVTGTFAGIIPAVEIDGQTISCGKRGALTLRLQKLYSEKLAMLYPKKAQG
tara:strand:+ start:271 stop:1200 length:930 start_codon:yes stop_codon:yes gene_type:complete